MQPRIFPQKLKEIRNNARSRKIIFNLNMKDITELMLAKNCTCCAKALNTGTIASHSSKKDASKMNIDRVDNNKGYVTGNVYALCSKCNRMKNDLTFASIEMILRYMKKYILFSTIPEPRPLIMIA